MNTVRIFFWLVSIVALGNEHHKNLDIDGNLVYFFFKIVLLINFFKAQNVSQKCYELSRNFLLKFLALRDDGRF